MAGAAVLCLYHLVPGMAAIWPGGRGMALGVGITGVVLYFLNFLASSELSYFGGGPNGGGRTHQDTAEWLAEVQQDRPVVTMKVECFHIKVWRSRNSNGTHSTRRKRVVTHTERRELQYAASRDETHAIIGLETFGIVKVRAVATWAPADEATRRALRQQREAFKAEFEGRDKSMKYSETWTLPAMKVDEEVKVEEDNDQPDLSGSSGGGGGGGSGGDEDEDDGGAGLVKEEMSAMFMSVRYPGPCWLECGVYFLCSLLFLSWPYRMLLEINSLRTTVKIHKKVSVELDDMVVGGAAVVGGGGGGAAGGNVP
eukprot:g6135.t1